MEKLKSALKSFSTYKFSKFFIIKYNDYNKVRPLWVNKLARHKIDPLDIVLAIEIGWR